MLYMIIMFAVGAEYTATQNYKRKNRKMSDFLPAVEYVLARENGLVEDKNDRGGITNFGISLRFLSSLSSENIKKYCPDSKTIWLPDLIKTLTKNEAKAIYLGEFWNKSLFEKIPSQEVCNYIFDMSVNLGIAPAIKCAQRACWSMMRERSILDDGILGEITLAKIKEFGNFLLPAMRSERAGYYRLVVASKPNNEKFINGWLNRAYGTKK